VILVAEWLHFWFQVRKMTLVWAANLADLELHTFLHRAPAIKRLTALALDLDPGAPADIVLCCQVALWFRGYL
jgi:bifunctional non-homologous end joining protein LigD